jgi:predicted NUDIX family NTP pyrophosphohydrolase
VAATSAGLLLYRVAEAGLEVLLVHPGGPLWARKDAGAWSIPKGEIAAGEDLLEAAIREVHEELGTLVAGPFIALAPQRQRSGKTVHAWAVEAAFDPATLVSNTFEMEWLPRSGRRQTFPEVDRAAWFTLDEARVKILAGQLAFLDELSQRLPGLGPDGT